MNTLLVSTSLLIASLVSQADSFQSSTELVGSRRGQRLPWLMIPELPGIAEGARTASIRQQLLPGETPQTTGTFALVTSLGQFNPRFWSGLAGCGDR